MGVETYLTVAFWMSLVGIGIRSLKIATKTYPYKREETLGMELVCLLLTIFFFVWISYLKFGL